MPMTTEQTTKTVELELGEVFATYEEAWNDMTGSYREIDPSDGQMLVLPNTSDFHPGTHPWAVWVVKTIS